MKRPYRELLDLVAANPADQRPQKSRRYSNGTREFIQHEVKSVRQTHHCTPASEGGHRCCPELLSDLAAKVASSSLPFQFVEDQCARVPEPVLQKFIYWSFPRQEADIRRYSALSCETLSQSNSSTASQVVVTSSQASPRGTVNDNIVVNQSPGMHVRLELDNRGHVSNDETNSFNNLSVVTSQELENLEIPFAQGVALAETGYVKEALQIGFHLSGTVEDDDPVAPAGTNNCNPEFASIYHVAITFDRCKITSAMCDCVNSTIFFCRHVVALSIYRIRKPNQVTIRSPISDTLQQMDRDQLQKLTQYLLAHHSKVLPSAQRVADLLIDPKSQLNALNGAPDPTAGAGIRDENRWTLRESEARRNVSSLLRYTNKEESSIQLQSLLSKVREMLRARDSNGSLLLTLITDELLEYSSKQTLVPTMHISSQSDICRMLWDQLGLLWVCVVLNPHISESERNTFVTQLQEWGAKSHCPPESGDDIIPSQGQPTRTGRNVLSRAVDAGKLRWDDPHLRKILESDSISASLTQWSSAIDVPNQSGCALYDMNGQLLWHEHIPTACARVEALRSHGYKEEAISLACAIARTIKQKCLINFKLHQQNQNAGAQQHSYLPKASLSQGLIGHPLHPIHILFDALSGSESDLECKKNMDALRSAAFEVCLLTLGQLRAMPEGVHNQEKMLASELALIKRLNKLTLNSEMANILCSISQVLVDGGPTSGLGEPAHREAVPLHCFATYLFHTLLPYDRELAFRVGIRAMRMPVMQRSVSNFYAEAYAPPPSNINTFVSSGRDPTIPAYEQAHLQHNSVTRWYILDKLEANQCALASALLQTAKGEVLLLREVVESVQRHVRNPSHIFQLSHDAYKAAATLPTGVPDSSMLNVAMQLSMQVLRMTIHGGSWHRAEMVSWLVTCATDIGLCALISIIKSWYTLFTPMEASTMVANCVVSPNTAIRLNLDPRQRDELFRCVCQMALQCAVKDPQSCAVCALTLCENLPSAFEAAYRVILDSSSKSRIDSSHLYTISRYLEQRGLRGRAFAVAFAATRSLTMAFNHDTHPAINDLLWTFQLAQSIGRTELSDMVTVVTRNIKCASVLSDILRTCTSGVNSSVTSNLANFGERSLNADGVILRPLLEEARNAFVNTIHSKLSHISPRHYTEFIDFLNKARETFMLASDGHARFEHLKANLKMIYKGKKKLLNLVSMRFD